MAESCASADGVTGTARRIEGNYRRRVDVVSGRVADFFATALRQAP